MTSHSMGMDEHHDVPQFDVRLVYAKDNLLGAKLYVDPSNRLVVKIDHVPSLPKPYVMVMFQGN